VSALWGVRPLGVRPFTHTPKIIKLVGLKNGGRLSPINLVTFAGTQNGEFRFRVGEFLQNKFGFT
jgi:hypothetical protein